MDWVAIILTEMMRAKFTGCIRINFANGGITNVNKIPAEETIRPPR